MVRVGLAAAEPLPFLHPLLPFPSALFKAHRIVDPAKPYVINLPFFPLKNGDEIA